MEIVIACGSMPFGPRTPALKSLGGSETAALMLAKALAEKGNKVTMFCNFPEQNSPDFVPPGTIDESGVRYIPLQAYQGYMPHTECDLAIIVRDPGLAMVPTQAKKKVLWMHDIATKRGMQRAFDGMQHVIDEVWTVSEWHKRQVHETTGYPLKNIIALRNGIVKYPPTDPALIPPRSSKMVLYAARPERGLENLIKPGGVMENLPEFKLVVAMYEHFPEHMRDYYMGIFARMKAMPNVEFVGGKPNIELRQMMHEAAAYIYPTQFEETSCIIAREACEAGLPFLTTKEGALPETLMDCGIFFEDYCADHGVEKVPEKGSPEWCKLFAEFFRFAVEDAVTINRVKCKMAQRTDLYWDGVADIVLKNANPLPVQTFSRAWSLVQDGDVIPAIAYIKAARAAATINGERNHLLEELEAQIEECYPFLYGRKSFDQHYEDIYTGKIGTPKDELVYHEDFVDGGRYIKIAEALKALPDGAKVLEVGCGAGHILGTLAKHVPQHDYTGLEFSPAATKTVNEGAKKAGRTNIRALVADGTRPLVEQFGDQFDAVIISEVLEHVTEPWDVLQKAEACLKKGGKVLVTVPYGPWEPYTFLERGRWLERAHIWHINKWMIRKMLANKNEKSITMLGLIGAVATGGRAYGNIFVSYDADHTPIEKVDALEKAMEHRSRQTAAACVIAMNNEDTILKMLNSIDQQVQYVQIALGPCTDRTREVVEQWMAAHPWMFYRIIDVPKIEAGRFGFDHARNVSIDGIDKLTDWFLWIDTDEYVSGDFRQYLVHNCNDGYMIFQHHFTTNPRGTPAQVDRPARLVRATAGYRARGHIHEHMEVPEGGPGRCTQLPDIDIGHTGYVNEDVRRARFERNLPFLQWDHNEIAEGKQPERKLHHFLWFRDLVHVMRYAAQQGRRDVALARAKEAADYYNDHWQDMATFGPGLFMSLEYLSEAHALLGKGTPVALHLQLDDRQATIQGRFESYDQLERVLGQILKPEFADRNHRYY